MAEWEAFNRVEPIGEWWAFWRSGLIAATMANLWGRKKGRKPFTPEQFMPDAPKQKRGKTVEDWKAMFRTVKADVTAAAAAARKK